METSFGHDFSKIRIHAGPRAAASAHAVAAQAYTVGRHVVFGAGRYAPGSGPGRDLLAHELAHTLQQGQTDSLPQRLEINRPGGSDEVEADRLSRQALAGGPRSKTRGEALSKGASSAPPILQRKALATVKEKTKPGAKACLVSIHADEKNALSTAHKMHKERCANLVFVEHQGTPSRRVSFEASVSGESFVCTVDPNRIFTDAGVDVWAGKCKKQVVAAARTLNKKRKKSARITIDDLFKSNAETTFKAEIQAFRTDASQKISRCRGGSGSADLSGTHPVVALHNNFNDAETSSPGLNIGTFKKNVATAAVPGNPSILKRDRKNPLTDRDNFLVATDASDISALKPDFNIVQQATGLKGATKTVGKGAKAKTVADTKKDDGSLSVALESQRYINIESQVRRGASFRAVNEQMANKVLDHLGLPAKGLPCVPTKKEPAGKAGAKTIQKGATGTLQAMADFLRRETDLAAAQNATRPAALPRDSSLPKKVAAKVKKGTCTTFPDLPTLEAEKDAQRKVIDAMPMADVLDWIIGVDKPPKWVTKKVGEQITCLEEGLKAAAKASGGTIEVAKKLTLKDDRRRSFKAQKKIWNEKFTFTRSGKWGAITPIAREKCPGLVQAGEREWDKGDDAHKDCFLNILSSEDRQREILQTSSAPGVSRHHLGTDFDFANVNPADWEKGQTGKKGWADDYSWLQNNASTYGFMQPFTTDSKLMRLGYIEERWHWSYYPIAQALVDWSKGLNNRLFLFFSLSLSDWANDPKRYTFILKHWPEFFFNVNETPQF